jgi:S1-C subfamily serine protease
MALQVTTVELQEETEAEPSDRIATRLGMEVQEITPEMAQNYGLSRAAGVIVVGVENGTPAEAAGLIAGDIIVDAAKIGAC